MKNIKNSKKGNSVEQDRWIDVHNDNVMRNMGLLRPLEQAVRDKNVWSKTPYEKQLLKKVHRICKDMHFHSCPRKTARIYDKLIIYLYKNNCFNKTTYSIKCWQHQIPDILNKFRTANKAKSVVRKYFWNGKTYDPRDLPFAR